MDVGLHWHLDDATNIQDPLIVGVAKDISLGAWKGQIWNRLAPPEEPVNGVEYEIYDRSLTGVTGVVGDGAGTGWVNGTTTTDLPLPTASIALITVGDVLKVEDEHVVVKSVDRSAETIDVWKRGFGGTTGAAHVDTTAFTIIGNAGHDVDLKNVESFAETTGKFTNYCQTIFEVIDMTFTDEIEARKAFEQKPQLIAEALNRVFKKLSASCILGGREAGSKSPQVPASTAGILYQLATTGNRERTPLRYNATGLTDPETVLKNALISCWNSGGDPTHIYLSPANKRKFDPLTEQFIRMNRGEAGVVGTDNGTAYMFQGKELPFVQDEDMPSDRIGLVTESKLNKGWRVGDMLRGPIAEPADSTREHRYSIQGSYFITVKGVGVDHIDCYNVSL